MSKNAKTQQLREVEITNAGGIVLKTILPSMNWYKGVPLSEAVEAQQLPANMLSDLTVPKGTDDEEDNWGEQPLVLKISNPCFLGTKACIKWYLDNALIELKPAVVQFITAFGLLEK